jgi:5-formyltetrahydrofolate cyclo-ligase
MNKTALRSLYQQKRGQLDQGQIQEYSRLLSEQLLDLLAGKPISFLHIFLPIARGREVDTWTIINNLQQNRSEIALVIPRMVPGTRELDHYRYDPDIALIDNRWAIPEPDPERCEPIIPRELDAVVVPLLCFDALGYRVGYGGGYYDRFLAKCRPDVIKVGVSLFEPSPAIDDTDAYDIPLDYAVTPSRVYRFGDR